MFSFFLFFDTWRSYARAHFKRSLTWTFLEIKIPREIRRGPKAMEQVFASMQSLMGGPSKLVEYYWDGEMILWYSLEIASFGGEIHFYIRTPTKLKNVLEAHIYAQYPDVEIEEVDDYTQKMPASLDELRKRGYDVWGTELLLDKDDAYPIRTHVDFESPDEYSQLDPIAALIEVMSKLKAGEELWLQIIASPAAPTWQARGQALVQKLKEEDKERVIVSEGGVDIKGVDRTPGKTDILKAIERNITKPGFQTTIRYVYLAPQSMYDAATARYGILGAFNQYRIQTLNGFRHNVKIRTLTAWYFSPFFFPRWRLTWRKRNIYRKFRNRFIKESSFLTQLWTGDTISPFMYVLNTEELATIYHFPSNLVLTAPSIQRVESKKVGPPLGLPIFGTEGEALKGFKIK